MCPLALGVDLGTSGLRLALIDAEGTVVAERSGCYGAPFDQPDGWINGIIDLIGALPRALRHRIDVLAIDGTSGTLLACRSDGRLLEGPLGRALPYHLSCEEQSEAVAELLRSGENRGTLSGPAASPSGSLARALRLLDGIRIDNPELTDIRLRHQADWVMGWMLGDWRWGEEGNNLRLGWDIRQQRWLGNISSQRWFPALPLIRTSGDAVGRLGRAAADALDLPSRCRVVAGTTDANAAVLAAEPARGDGITVLGTTLVLKQFVPAPLKGAGISNHRVGGQWLAGGASNAGAGILRRFFDDAQIEELSRQIDPDRHTGLWLRPLLRRGERFPDDDPSQMPILEPRPTSDALYLQALLEGIARIEARGWKRLRELGAPPVQRVLTLGGGARNPQWRTLREDLLGLPVLNRPRLTAALGMARLAGRHLPGESGAGRAMDPASGSRMGDGAPSPP